MSNRLIVGREFKHCDSWDAGTAQCSSVSLIPDGISIEEGISPEANRSESCEGFVNDMNI